MGDSETDELRGPDLKQGVARADLVTDHPMLGHVDGEQVLIVRHGDEVFAVSATCTHCGGQLDEGLVVDGKLHTSAQDLFAIGDVAKFPYRRERVCIEHGVVAQRHDQAVARTLLGRGQTFTDVPFFFWSRHWDVGLSYVGHATSLEHITVHGSLEQGDAAVVYRNEDRRIEAVLTVGRDALALQVEYLMESSQHHALETLFEQM